ncbi:MAG: GGDEF domain-containing protein [Bdellovibrionales bacterium]
MKKWISKLIDQFELDWTEDEQRQAQKFLSEELATLVFLLDTFNKNLFELDSHPIRKTRETLDELSKELLSADKSSHEKALFRLRQFMSAYRLDEYTYIQKTFDEFRRIIWDFVEQLGDEINFEDSTDKEIRKSFHELQEAVEANSIEDLKLQSRHFIDSYTEYQTKKEEHKADRLENVRKNLAVVKKKLVEAHHNMKRDHLTHAYNRKSFDDQMVQQWKLYQVSKTPVSIIAMDIDHFKKFNDTYGHAIGDFVLVECVKVLKEAFSRDNDFVARTGGEEFVVILPDYRIDHAVQKAEKAMQRIRNSAFVHEGVKLQFTMSMGIAELYENESVEQWMKRADDALYASKQNGRNKFTVSKREEDVNTPDGVAAS